MDRSEPPICNSQKGQCVALASEIVGGKWTPMLLFALGNGQHRFGELRAAVGGVNPRTLSARLDTLEEQGVITKAAFPEVPPRVTYELTDKGRDLLPILESMITWGAKHGA